MCGIVGILALQTSAQALLQHIGAATQALSHRGPDGGNTYQSQQVALGHRRLGIIDRSAASDQPFCSADGRYVMVFNGEIFNFRQLRQQLSPHYHFTTQGDTEVLLCAYQHWGSDMLQYLNGFFAFIIYDTQQQSLFAARDRFGVKPLLLYASTQHIILASELRAITAFGVARHIDHSALQLYLQLNYIPAPYSILQGVQKVPPATFVRIDAYGNIDQQVYYQPPHPSATPFVGSYADAQHQLRQLLTDAVQLRLIADVPVACFLSGGIDSSVITAIAAQQSSQLRTFSVGFADAPHYDETPYAQLVAQMYGTQHTVFSLSTANLYQQLPAMLDSLDEPFADSSALAFYILSQHTSQHMRVALSGDGSDEIFAGYHKHHAEYLVQHPTAAAHIVRRLSAVWQALPQQRDTYWGNKIRQLHRFAQAAQLPAAQRYQQWASIASAAQVEQLLLPAPISAASNQQPLVQQWWSSQLAHFGTTQQPITDTLLADVRLVLEGDMLHKADAMSMANSLEIRTPFLDYRVLNFAFSLPDHYKIDHRTKKKVLQDAFRHQLPPQLYRRPKQGFEIPITPWLRAGLLPLLTEQLLHPRFIAQQGLFRYEAISGLLAQLQSAQPADAPARLWALLVFQWWWQQHKMG